MASEIVTECLDLVDELIEESRRRGHVIHDGDFLQAAATLLLTRQVWHLRQDLSEAKG